MVKEQPPGKKKKKLMYMDNTTGKLTPLRTESTISENGHQAEGDPTPPNQGTQMNGNNISDAKEKKENTDTGQKVQQKLSETIKYIKTAQVQSTSRKSEPPGQNVQKKHAATTKTKQVQSTTSKSAPTGQNVQKKQGEKPKEVIDNTEHQETKNNKKADASKEEKDSIPEEEKVKTNNNIMEETKPIQKEQAPTQNLITLPMDINTLVQLITTSVNSAIEEKERQREEKEKLKQKTKEEEAELKKINETSMKKRMEEEAKQKKDKADREEQEEKVKQQRERAREKAQKAEKLQREKEQKQQADKKQAEEAANQKKVKEALMKKNKEEAKQKIEKEEKEKQEKELEMKRKREASEERKAEEKAKENNKAKLLDKEKSAKRSLDKVKTQLAARQVEAEKEAKKRKDREERQRTEEEELVKLRETSDKRRLDMEATTEEKSDVGYGCDNSRTQEEQEESYEKVLVEVEIMSKTEEVPKAKGTSQSEIGTPVERPATEDDSDVIQIKISTYEANDLETEKQEEEVITAESGNNETVEMWIEEEFEETPDSPSGAERQKEDRKSHFSLEDKNAMYNAPPAPFKSEKRGREEKYYHHQSEGDNRNTRRKISGDSKRKEERQEVSVRPTRRKTTDEREPVLENERGSDNRNSRRSMSGDFQRKEEREEVSVRHRRRKTTDERETIPENGSNSEMKRFKYRSNEETSIQTKPYPSEANNQSTWNIDFNRRDRSKDREKNIQRKPHPSEATYDLRYDQGQGGSSRDYHDPDWNYQHNQNEYYDEEREADRALCEYFHTQDYRQAKPPFDADPDERALEFAMRKGKRDRGPIIDVLNISSRESQHLKEEKKNMFKEHTSQQKNYPYPQMWEPPMREDQWSEALWKNYRKINNKEDMKTYQKNHFSEFQPAFCKEKGQNYRRCLCGFNGSIGTPQQFLQHHSNFHSHLQFKQVHCLACDLMGKKTRFLSPIKLAVHICNQHEKMLITGHSKPTVPGIEYPRDTDPWLSVFTQLIEAKTLATLAKQGHLSRSYYQAEEKYLQGERKNLASSQEW